MLPGLLMALPVHTDFAGQQKRLRLLPCLGKAALNEQYIEPLLWNFYLWRVFSHWPDKSYNASAGCSALLKRDAILETPPARAAARHAHRMRIILPEPYSPAPSQCCAIPPLRRARDT